MVLQELSSKEIYKLLNMLEKLLPDSLAAYQWLLTQQKWAENSPEMKLTILCLNGDAQCGTMVGLVDNVAARDKIYGLAYAKSEKVEFLKKDLVETNKIDWERLTQFAVCLERLIPMMAGVLREKGFKHTNFHIPCYLYYMTKQKAESCSIPELADNVRVSDLDESHLSVVLDNWPHNDVVFQPVVAKMLKFNSSTGVFVQNEDGEEELASMVLQAEYGGIGLLQTVPKFRRKGFAAVSLAHQCRALAKAGFAPYGTVICENKVSCALFEKVGFEVLTMATFVKLTKE